MTKNILVITFVFYAVGTLAATGSYMKQHWRGGWGFEARFERAFERAVTWPVDLADKLV